VILACVVLIKSQDVTDGQTDTFAIVKTGLYYTMLTQCENRSIVIYYGYHMVWIVFTMYNMHVLSMACWIRNRKVVVSFSGLFAARCRLWASGSHTRRASGIYEAVGLWFGTGHEAVMLCGWERQPFVSGLPRPTTQQINCRSTQRSMATGWSAVTNFSYFCDLVPNLQNSLKFCVRRAKTLG